MNSERNVGHISLYKTVVVLYLAGLALLPWSKFPPFPWLHENAQWSDALFGAATALWLLLRWRTRTWPRLSSIHAAMGLYFLAAVGSFLMAAADHQSGAAKLLGMAELCAISIVTADLLRDANLGRLSTFVVAASSVAVAAVCLYGLVLFYFGVHTPLIGFYGDHLARSRWYARVQGAAAGPNVLASFCVFASAVVALRGAELPKILRHAARGALAVTVALTFSHNVLAFILAAAVRNVRRRAHLWVTVILAGLFVCANSSLTFLNPSLNAAHPLDSRITRDRPAGRWQTVTSTLKTIQNNPLWGSGPGSSPGWFKGRPYDAHMTVLNIAGTLGLPALVAFVCIFVLLWRSSERPVNKTVWGAFAGFALSSLVCDIEDFRHLWVMIGIASSVPNKNPCGESLDGLDKPVTA